MWGLSIVSWNFIALLFGVVAVIALYVSATDRRIAKAHERAAGLEKEAADARLETAQLEAIVAGRQLTPENIQEIAEELKVFSGRHLYISSYSGDAETARFGLQIKAALQGAGVRVDDNLGRVVAERGGVTFGVEISGPNADKEFTDAICESLRAHGKTEVSNYVVVPTMCIEDNMIGIMVAL